MLADMISCSYYYTEKKGKRQIRTKVLVPSESFDYNVIQVNYADAVCTICGKRLDAVQYGDFQLHIQMENE